MPTTCPGGSPTPNEPTPKPGTQYAWLVERLKHPFDSCEEWPFRLTAQGYGRLWAGGKGRPVTHLVLELTGSLRPTPEHVACHECDTPSCFAPQCLRWDTQQGNINDKVKRGRCAVGENNSLSKYTEHDIRVMFCLERLGFNDSETARLFETRQPHISKILNGEAWTHLGLKRSQVNPRDARGGFKGIKKVPSNRWQAQIQGTYIGTFDTKEEAACAWDDAALTLRGTKAKLNFPSGGPIPRKMVA